MVRRWLGAGLVALLWSGLVLADHESCTRYIVNFGALTVPGEPAEGTSQAEACADAVALWDAWDDSSSDRQARSPSVVGSNCMFEARSCAKSNGACGSWTMPGPYAITTSGTMACPHDPCEGMAGKTQTLFGASAGGQSCSQGCALAPRLPTTRICGGLTGCDDGPGSPYLGAYTYTGVSCAVGGETPQSASCFMLNGEQVCAEFDEESEFVAAVNQDKLKPLEVGGCVSFESGGVACVVEGLGAVAPENLPNNGDAEDPQPATPTVTIQEGDQTINYYGPTIVAGSTAPVPTGSGSGSGGQDGVVGGAGSICSGDNCYGDIPAELSECADDLAACVAAIGATGWTTITENVPILGFVADLHEAFDTAGVCPAVEMTMLGETYDLMGPVCTLVGQHEGLFHLIFQILWSLVGLRIILESE